MAYGIIKIIPASTHVDIALSGAGGGSDYPSIKVLNPNDGVVYIARNRDCLSAGYGDWDWKVPSQSYAMLPGPFTSVGAFYLDQSGAGRQGEFTIYPSQQKLDDPMFLAIGRALQALTTSLDVTEGAQPANPGSGILRLWADGNDVLHLLNGAGVDRFDINSLTTLGGVLTGKLPNPGIALTNFGVILGADAIVNALTVILTANIVAGTWLIFGRAMCAAPAGATCTLVINDSGATKAISDSMVSPPTLNQAFDMYAFDLFAYGSNVTMQLSVALPGNGTVRRLDPQTSYAATSFFGVRIA